jgi:hypothetical protein
LDDVLKLLDTIGQGRGARLQDQGRFDLVHVLLIRAGGNLRPAIPLQFPLQGPKNSAVAEHSGNRVQAVDLQGVFKGYKDTFRLLERIFPCLSEEFRSGGPSARRADPGRFDKLFGAPVNRPAFAAARRVDVQRMWCGGLLTGTARR